jgi:hypothetical protein
MKGHHVLKENPEWYEGERTERKTAVRTYKTADRITTTITSTNFSG